MKVEEKKYHVQVSPSANDRVSQHFEFMAKVNMAAAERLLDTLIKDMHSLETNPASCPSYERPYIPKEKYRYKLSAKRYRIVFSIENNTVFIDDIEDCRQNDDKNLLFEDEKE
jgi:mRNA-degrading endonuclease RelE of RelBE toxin-antitoxin system